MTSKLIEALNKCETRKSYENVRYTLIDDELRDYIEESLERLETLEKENRDLKETIEIRKQMNINLIDFGSKLKQENEKLKKALEILKDNAIIELLTTKENNVTYYWLKIESDLCENNTFEKLLTKQEYELLKEVLVNE